MKNVLIILLMVVSTIGYSRTWVTPKGSIEGDVYKYDDEKVYLYTYRKTPQTKTILHKDLCEADKYFLAKTRPLIRKLEAYKHIETKGMWFNPTITKEEVEYKPVQFADKTKDKQIFSTKNAEYKTSTRSNRITEYRARQMAELTELTIKTIKNLDFHPYANHKFPRYTRSDPEIRAENKYILYNVDYDKMRIYIAGDIERNGLAKTGSGSLGTSNNLHALSHEVTHLTLAGCDGTTGLGEGIAEFIGYGIGYIQERNTPKAERENNYRQGAKRYLEYLDANGVWEDPEEPINYFDFETIFRENARFSDRKLRIRKLYRILLMPRKEIEQGSNLQGAEQNGSYTSAFLFYVFLYMNEPETLYKFLEAAIEPSKLYTNTQFLYKEDIEQAKKGIEEVFKSQAKLKELEYRMTNFFKGACGMDVSFQ